MAKTFCESSDSHIASFYYEEELNFVRDMVINGTTGKKKNSSFLEFFPL